MKVRLMIGGLSKCRAVSPANRAKSERSHAEWRHKSRYGRAVATGQPAETNGVDLPQARRLAETEVVTRAGSKTTAARYPACARQRGPVRAHCTRLRGGWTLRHLHHDEIRAVLVAVRPLTVLRHHRAGLALVRGRAPPLSLIRFCSLAHFTIVSTSENRPKPVQTSAQWTV